MRTVPRGLVVIEAAVVCAVVLAGCGGNQTGSSSATDAGTASSPPSFDCAVPPSDPVSAEQASFCVYDGWTSQDEARVTAYGREGVTDELPLVESDPGLHPEGCVDGGGASLTGLVCTWAGENSDGPIVLEMQMSGDPQSGYRVAEIAAVR